MVFCANRVSDKRDIWNMLRQVDTRVKIAVLDYTSMLAGDYIANFTSILAPASNANGLLVITFVR